MPAALLPVRHPALSQALRGGHWQGERGQKNPCKHKPLRETGTNVVPHRTLGLNTGAVDDTQRVCWAAGIWAYTAPKCPDLTLAPLLCPLAAPRGARVLHPKPLRGPGFQAISPHPSIHPGTACLGKLRLSVGSAQWCLHLPPPPSPGHWKLLPSLLLTP